MCVFFFCFFFVVCFPAGEPKKIAHEKMGSTSFKNSHPASATEPRGWKRFEVEKKKLKTKICDFFYLHFVVGRGRKI